jgi:hypothetical protein
MAVHEILTKPSTIHTTFIQPTNTVKNSISNWNISLNNRGCIISGLFIVIILLLLFLMDDSNKVNTNVQLPNTNYKIHYF